MKLNHECVRHLLLTLEEINSVDRPTMLSEIETHDLMLQYNSEDILYTIKMLESAGYIDAQILSYFGGNDALIRSISWSGHQFLDTIRDDKVWRETKKAVNSFSSVSLDTLSKVASSILTKLIMGE